MDPNHASPERIMQIATGGWAAGILGAAASHAVFTHLEAGDDTVDRLAGQAGISERGAQTLLDGLVGLGLIELRDGRYRNSAEAAAFLVEGRPGYLGGFARVLLADIGDRADLAEVVRTGVPVTKVTTDVPDSHFWEELVPAIAPLSVPSAMVAADILRLADAGEITILDVGGGSGIYSAVWLGLNPSARATQLDWAPVNAIARRLVAERGVGERFSCIDGDFHTTDFGSDAFDVAVYSHIAHQESPEENVAVFGRFRQALRAGGTLVVNDFVVDDDRSGPPFPLIFASEMLLRSAQGGTWRQADYRAWLGKAGFDDVSFHPTASPATVILAR